MLALFALFLINMSDFDFLKVWLSEHKSNHWQLVTSQLKKGAGITVATDQRWKSYDLRVQYTPRNMETWQDFDQNTKRVTITILADKRWQAHFEQ